MLASRRGNGRARHHLRGDSGARSGVRRMARRGRREVHEPAGSLELRRLGRHGLQFDLEHAACHRPEPAANRSPDPGRDHRAQGTPHHRECLLGHVLQHATEGPADGGLQEAADGTEHIAQELLEFLLAADLEQLGRELGLLLFGKRGLELAAEN